MLKLHLHAAPGLTVLVREALDAAGRKILDLDIDRPAAVGGGHDEGATRKDGERHRSTAGEDDAERCSALTAVAEGHLLSGLENCRHDDLRPDSTQKTGAAYDGAPGEKGSCDA